MKLYGLITVARSAALTCAARPGTMEAAEAVPDIEELERLATMSTGDPMHGATSDAREGDGPGRGPNAVRTDYAGYGEGFNPMAGTPYGRGSEGGNPEP